MASDFLNKLKNAVENGEFNSEAAKKIVEIDKLADNVKIPSSNREIAERLDELKNELGGEAKQVTEEEAAAINAEYEKQMEIIKKQDAINTQLATLIEIEDMVTLSIQDMLTFVNELEEKFKVELSEGNPAFNDLTTKLVEVKRKYNTFINN
jgi:hypothetical protein